MRTMGRRAERWVRAGWAALLATGLLAGCTEARVDEEQLSALVFTPEGAQIPAVSGLETVRLTAMDYSRREVLAQAEFPYGSGGGTLGGVTFAERLQLVVEGLDALGNPLLQGRSMPFRYLAGDRVDAPRIFLSTPDTFSEATALTGEGDALQPQEVRFQVASPRAGHAAVRLKNGLVLVVGGAQLTTEAAEGLALPGLPEGLEVDSAEDDGGVLDTAELYDPATGLFFPMPSMRFPRAFHTATLLDDGRVLVAGGVTVLDGDDGPELATLASAEIFDPSQPSAPWTLVAGSGEGLSDGRAWHTATLRRSDGSVVLIGGRQIDDGAVEVLGTAEIFNPQRDRFELNPGDEPIEMETPRAGHTAELVLSGRGAGKTILVLGGEGEGGPLRSTEVLTVVGDGARSAFSEGPAMRSARVGHASRTASGNGGRQIVVVGGRGADGALVEEIEAVDVTVGEFTSQGRLSELRDAPSLIELPQTQDMVVLGGLGEDGRPVRAAERLAFNPVDGSYTRVPVDGPMVRARHLHTATLMDNGLVLVTGGVSGASLTSQDDVEFFNADDGEPGFSYEASGGESGFSE